MPENQVLHFWFDQNNMKLDWKWKDPVNKDSDIYFLSLKVPVNHPKYLIILVQREKCGAPSEDPTYS